MIKNYITTALFCVLTFFGRQEAYAQPKTASSSPALLKETVYWDFHSTIIGDDFTIYVHSPPQYDTTKTKFPVLYMADGDWDTGMAIDAFNMLRQDYNIKETMTVSIGYGTRTNQRNRDLDPAGGGPKFLAFIEKELIPFINKTYRVTDEKALLGYSLGGMFANYVLFERPGLFNTILICAPGNGGVTLMPAAQKYFTANKELNANVFLGVGGYEHVTVNNIEQFKAYLLKQNCKSLKLETAITPNAGHGAATAHVIEDAVKFAYCKRHTAIIIPAEVLAKYTGTYAVPGQPNAKFKLYVENNKLYFTTGELPQELTPFTNDGFFQYEYEKADIIFKSEGGKMYILYDANSERPTRLNKVD